jgi:hypothetical protein
MVDKQGYKVIDADAHVIETEDSWTYLEGSDRKFKPQRRARDRHTDSL